jgi:uncharacterized protein (TIGR02145 family)/uncharacterized repeat protein (TIGR02543 family)
MKIVINFLLLISVMSVVSLVSKCTPGRLDCISGTGSSSEVTGRLFEPGGKKPAQDASVVMRSFDYLPEIPHLRSFRMDNGNFVCSTSTNHIGEYGFSTDMIPEGMYCIEGRDNRNNCVLIDSLMIVDDSTLPLLSDTLKPPATIQGRIPLNDDSSKAYVQVYGLDISVKADLNGVFSLNNLPEGNLRLNIAVARGHEQSYDLVSVAAKAGDTSVLQYTVTFDSRGGGAAASQIVNYGSPATSPTNPTKMGYTFTDWYRDSVYKTRWTFATDKVTDNVTLYAKWTINHYIVSFDPRGGSAVASQTVNYNNHALEPAPPTNKSCEFAGWFKEPACLSRWQFANEPVIAPVTLSAKWIVRDIDGNIYTAVTIGNQVWLKENLKTTQYKDGSAIPLVTDSVAWENLETPGYCWYGNNEAEYKNTYGALYNWYAVNTGKLAPKGWRVSTDADWDALQDALLAQGYNWDGTTDNTIAKALAAQSDWNGATTNGAIGNDLTQNNGSGFSAFPGGGRYYDHFIGMSYYGYWWSTSELNESDAVTREMGSDGIVVYCLQYRKKSGFSVRCVRNE